jgi:hypothetical protein
MAEVLLDFGNIRTADDTEYHVKACGSAMDDTVWQGWIEFEPTDGGETIRSPRETTQPNRTDTVYWATGLTAVYLEGALQRALRPANRPGPVDLGRPAFDAPAPPVTSGQAAGTAVLNPFSVYRKGEQLLRDQLHALSDWHLVNIITAYGLSTLPQEELARMPPAELTELIVAAVRASSREPVT